MLIPINIDEAKQIADLHNEYTTIMNFINELENSIHSNNRWVLIINWDNPSAEKRELDMNNKNWILQSYKEQSQRLLSLIEDY